MKNTSNSRDMLTRKLSQPIIGIGIATLLTLLYLSSRRRFAASFAEDLLLGNSSLVKSAEVESIQITSNFFLKKLIPFELIEEKCFLNISKYY